MPGYFRPPHKYPRGNILGPLSRLCVHLAPIERSIYLKKKRAFLPVIRILADNRRLIYRSRQKERERERCERGSFRVREVTSLDAEYSRNIHTFIRILELFCNFIIREFDRFDHRFVTAINRTARDIKIFFLLRRSIRRTI